MEPSSIYTGKRELVLSTIGSLSILLLLISTNPQTMPAAFLLIFPLLVAFTSFMIAKLILRFFTNANEMSVKIISSLVAMGSLLVVLLGSLGQLGLQDFLLASLLIGGLVFYLKRLQITR